MRFAVGSYVGNGLDDRPITGLGFQPDLVIIKCHTWSQYACWRSSTMSGDVSAIFASALVLQSNLIQSLEADGFTVGTNTRVNGSGQTYHWMAFKDNGGGDFKVGSYTGNGTDNRDITGLGFEPDLVCIKCDSSSRGYWRVTANSGDQAMEFSIYGDSADRIQGFVGDGFQVGLQQNANGTTYYYFTFKAVAEYIAQGSYTGNGADNRSIAGVGFQPDLVWIKCADTPRAVLRPSTVSGDLGLQFDNQVSLADTIQALEPDGFQIGTTNLVNQSGYTYRWAAWKAGDWGGPTPKSGADSGASSESSSLAEVFQGNDAGAGVEASDLESALAPQDSGVGGDTALLGFVVGDSGGSGEVAAVIEIAEKHGNDAGAGAEATSLASILVAIETGAGDNSGALSSLLAGDDAAGGTETAAVLVLLEYAPISGTIDSRLGSFADSVDLALAEYDAANPMTPAAKLWRILNQGSLIRIRLGLAGQDKDDYGLFRVDECSLEAAPDSWRTRIRGRDKAALLIEERAAEEHSYGVWPEDNPEQKTYPSARSLAQTIAEKVGLKLVWKAPNYTLTSFPLHVDESLSGALSRLLEPLRQSSRYYTDAWVDGEHLVIQRRGSGPNLGMIDCALGQVKSIRRTLQPLVGEIEVYGETYVYFTIHEYPTQQSKAGSGEGEPQASVRITEDSPTHRVVETGIVQANGDFAIITRETEDLAYQEVNDANGNWLGRVLMKSEVQEENDLHTSNPKRNRKTVEFGYDDQWRLVLKDERTETYQTDGTIKKTGHIVTRYEQLTPTDVRTTTAEFKIAADGTETVKKGFPKWEMAPGTLQSSIRQAQDPQGKWQTQPDGSAPPNEKQTEYTAQYQGRAHGGGTIPVSIQNDNLVGDDICQQIADDLADESGKWIYTVNLFWPRPFRFRKGDKVTLTNLPGDCPDLVDAVILGKRTTYDEGEAQWTHDIEIECWREA